MRLFIILVIIIFFIGLYAQYKSLNRKQKTFLNSGLFIFISIICISLAKNTEEQNKKIQQENLRMYEKKQKEQKEKEEKEEKERIELTKLHEQKEKEEKEIDNLIKEEENNKSNEDSPQENEKNYKEYEKGKDFYTINKILANVLRVVDGDTIIAKVNGKIEKIRLIGIDTPESVHPDKSRNTEAGIVASNFTKSELLNKDIYLEFDVQQRDKYGRLLAYVYYKDGIMFNKTLLENGYAKIATYPPNVKYVEDFRKISHEETKKTYTSNNNTNNTSSSKKNSTTTNTNHNNNNSNKESNGNYYIKGNKNSMIYHLPGQRDYNKISPKNIVWFRSEEEAIAAGYRKAKR